MKAASRSVPGHDESHYQLLDLRWFTTYFGSGYAFLRLRQRIDVSSTLFGFSLYFRTVNPRPIASKAIKQFSFSHPTSLSCLLCLVSLGGGFKFKVWVISLIAKTWT